MDEKLFDQVSHVAQQAALAAGALLRLNYEKPHDITLKGVIDPVTESDFASQKTIIRLIRQTFPDHGILAEEVMDGEQNAGEGAAAKAPAPQETSPVINRWIIDPLDGTVNFAHGFPMFCVSIAFEAAGMVEYGVVYDPLREELFEARRGGGAWVNGRPLEVSRVDKLERGLLATGFPYDIRERLPKTLARMGRAMAASQGLRRAGSAALDLSYVAAGRLDGFFEENLKPWDTAAGMLLVLEAGGRISTFDGGPYDISAPNILASNGLLHFDLLALLAEK
uniref:Inositol-1-monophosphatase n=1 Tax=Desulfobacca acetoxidans TaxID=60893 RepID=A0A7V6A3A1_9BACT